MNWTRNWAFALAILAIALVSLSSGLFEDQAGKDDWYVLDQHSSLNFTPNCPYARALRCAGDANAPFFCP